MLERAAQIHANVVILDQRLNAMFKMSSSLVSSIFIADNLAMQCALEAALELAGQLADT